MFPPEKTSDLQTVVQNLWSSLNRAGGQLDDQCIIEPASKNSHNVLLKLKDSLTPESQDAIREYVKSYLELSGWHTGGVVFAKRYIRFRLTSASSKTR